MKPWLSGPVELLEHAGEHLRGGTPFDYRIALISVDAAVELAIKTYLGLPKRVRGTDGPSRRKLQDASSSFPDLLDLLEVHAPDLGPSIELGDIEWYHRLRNALYHDGNGITVDSEKVDSYFQLARILLQQLFGESLSDTPKIDPVTTVGNIILKWSLVEHNARCLWEETQGEEIQRRQVTRDRIFYLAEAGVVSHEASDEFDRLRAIRNGIVHATEVPSPDELSDVVTALDALNQELLTAFAKALPNRERE